MDKTMTQDQRLNFLVEAFKADTGDYPYSSCWTYRSTWVELPPRTTSQGWPIPILW